MVKVQTAQSLCPRGAHLVGKCKDLTGLRCQTRPLNAPQADSNNSTVGTEFTKGLILQAPTTQVQIAAEGSMGVPTGSISYPHLGSAGSPSSIQNDHPKETAAQSSAYEALDSQPDVHRCKPKKYIEYE